MSQVPYRFTIAYAETRFGRFWLRPPTLDIVCASPAFERTDVDRLLALMQAHVSASKRILFLDIRAGFGTYTVTVGNRFRRYQDLRIVSYEPAPETLRMLRANVSLNGLEEKVTIIPYTASAYDGAVLPLDYDPGAPGSSGITSTERVRPGHKTISVQGVTIDASCGQDLVNVDVVFVKIDVEGHETGVVRGGRALFEPKWRPISWSRMR